jgi:ferredoxin
VNGTSLALYGSSAGSDTLTVCASGGGCGTLSVTVTGATSGSNGSIIFGTTNPTLATGQSMNISLSGASNYTISSNASPSIVQASVNSNSLALYGSSAGTDTLTVCASGGGCGTLTVTVTGGTTTTTTATTPTPTVSVVANSALLAEIQTLQNGMTQLLTQIQTMETNLSQLEAQVSAGSGSGISTTNTGTVTSSGTSYNFTELLTVGSQDAQVTALQNRLAALGFYSGSATGFYGALTQTAVEKYQTAHGLTPTGYVGPGTRAALNAGN